MPFRKYCYDGSQPFRISKCSTDETSLCVDRRDAESKLEQNNELIDELQAKLYAEKKEGVIFLFQAMDAAGKDGTIRAVLTCLSPHGVHETAFKAPPAPTNWHTIICGASPGRCLPRVRSQSSTAPTTKTSSSAKSRSCTAHRPMPAASIWTK